MLTIRHERPEDAPAIYGVNATRLWSLNKSYRGHPQQPIALVYSVASTSLGTTFYYRDDEPTMSPSDSSSASFAPGGLSLALPITVRE